MSELVQFFGDAVELLWRGWKLVTPVLALSAWLRVVAQAREEEVCVCERGTESQPSDDEGCDTIH